MAAEDSICAEGLLAQKLKIGATITPEEEEKEDGRRLT
jgi:hypothetical protein